MGKVSSKLSKTSIRNSFRRRKNKQKQKEELEKTEGQVESTSITETENAAQASNGVAAQEIKEEAPAEVPVVTPAAPVEEAKDEEAKPVVEEAPKDETPTSESENETPAAPAAVEEPPKAESPEQPVVESTMSEDQAALKIQAVVRGKKAREEVKAMKSEGDEEAVSAEEPTVPETAPETPDTTSDADAEQPAPTENAEGDEAEEAAAAVKIQASFRGMKARKEVEAMKDSSKDDVTPAAADETAPESSEN